MLPISVNLQNKKCIVIGGGKVASRRIQTLLAEGANVTVISPELLPELMILVEDQHIKWFRRPFDDGDCLGAFLVIAATNRKAVNERVAYDCRQNQLVNIVDNPEKSNFYFPAVGRKGLLSIAVSTEGASPILAKNIRDRVMEQFDNEFEQYVAFVKEARALILSMKLEERKKRTLLNELIDNRFLSKAEQIQFLSRIHEQDNVLSAERK